VQREQELARERGVDGKPAQKGLRRNEVFAMVVVPTRELAVQVHAVFELFFEGLRKYVADQRVVVKMEEGDEEPVDVPEEIVEEIYPSPLLLVSGQSSTSKSTALPAPSPIIIGTPGRISSYLSSSLSTSSSSTTSAYARARKHLSLTPFSLLILDEADSLLSSPDHLRNMHTIWSTLPRQRRNWLFSATMMDVLSERSGGLLGQSGLERAGLKNLTRVVVKVETKVRGKEDAHEVKQRRTPVR
jgi:ATP-dependent RNA helicase DDX55/SPB4